MASSPTVMVSVATSAYIAKVVRYAPYHEMPPHAHEEHGFSAVIAGALVEEANHQSIIATAGWVVNKPRALVHANRFGPEGATLLAVTPTAADHGAPKRWQWAHNPRAFQSAVRLLRASDTAGTFAELVAALESSGVTGQEKWLDSVREALDDGSALSVAQLALQAGVHPVYLARAFRNRHGVSIRGYRRQIQVRRAIQLAVTTRLPLSQVALEAGFVDHSHMCRAFRDVAAWSPKHLRTPSQLECREIPAEQLQAVVMARLHDAMLMSVPRGFPDGQSGRDAEHRPKPRWATSAAPSRVAS